MERSPFRALNGTLQGIIPTLVVLSCLISIYSGVLIILDRRKTRSEKND